MKIKYVTGNLLNCKEKVIAHGANAQGVMGAGVALDIKKKWPVSYEFYRHIYLTSGLKLGDVYTIDVDDDTIIAHCITQQSYGKGVQVDYSAVISCMRGLNDIMNHEAFYGDPVAMPMIGAGLGGGDWNIISEIIEKESTNFQPVVYKLR